MSKDDRDSLITGVVIGSVMGVLGGLLWAPHQGKDTRKIIKKTMASIPDMAKVQTTQISAKLANDLTGKLQGAIDRLQVAIAAGIIASQEFKNNESKPMEFNEETDE